MIMSEVVGFFLLNFIFLDMYPVVCSSLEVEQYKGFRCQIFLALVVFIV